MSLSTVPTDVRNEQQQTKLNENEFSNNEKLNQDDETQLRFNQSNGNNTNNNFKSSSIENRSDSVIDSSKNVDNSEKSFSLNRLNEQMVHSIVDQNNNEYFSTDKYAAASITDLNNNIISNEDAKKLDNATNQSNLLLQQSLNQIVNGLGNSFVPSSTTNDLLSNQISYLNQTATGTNSSQLDNQDSQGRRQMTHNFNNPLTINRSNSSVAQHSPQPNSASALFKQSTFNNSNWSNSQQNPTSGWSTNSQSLLNQPSNQQQTQQSLNTWNRFNTFNSLSSVDKQQQPRLSNSNLSANSVSPLKKPNSQLIGSSVNLTNQQTLLNTQQLNQLSPSKFRQNRQPLMNVNTLNAMLMMQNTMDINNNAPSAFDNLRYPLEQQLLEIMRSSDLQNDTLRGKCSPASNECGLNAKGLSRRRGKSPFFTSSDQELLDGSNQISGESTERFSRKVFVGGLPPDIDEEEIKASFRRFGSLAVDWPHKAESKSYFPPKGYAFLLFQDEASVQSLIEVCIAEEDKLYLCVSSPTIRDKPVQIRPWRLSDADFVLDASMPLDPRKTVFVGGVPRPIKAVELAMIMDRLYGGVCYAGIDTDPELKYPKGAGRVAFSNQQSYIAAISARFVQLQHADIEKRVEIKPYVLDDQICDECGGSRCNGKFAPFFCANVCCLQYYCDQCWQTIHQRPGREFHKPLVKEGADRPRAVPFKFKKVV